MAAIFLCGLAVPCPGQRLGSGLFINRYSIGVSWLEHTVAF
jgi:hypothetical protein